MNRPAWFNKQSAKVYFAYCRGLESIIKKRLPGYQRRLTLRVDKLIGEFPIIEHRHGRKAAMAWLIHQLQHPKVPDRRRGKSLVNDQKLCRQFAVLKKDLQPIFNRHPLDIRARNREAARIVSAILGRQHAAQDLPAETRLSEFCHEVLGTNPVRISRARRRVHKSIGAELKRIVAQLEVIASSTDQVSPYDPKGAFEYIKKEVLPYYE